MNFFTVKNVKKAFALAKILLKNINFLVNETKGVLRHVPLIAIKFLCWCL